MNRAQLAVAVLSAVAAASIGLDAQARSQAPMRFQGVDRNNDGVIQREEWNGSSRSFTVHDWNGDGVLSGDEVRAGAQRNTDWETADHNPNRMERNLSWTVAAFTNLDHNGDARLTTNEWHYDLETFRRIDSNRDNAVNRTEFLGENIDDGRGDRFDDLDVNNNGRVERSEWYFSSDSFGVLDRNGDNVLSRFEVVGSQDSTGDARDEFGDLDFDHDGSISRREWHWSARSFNQSDRDGDGVLSRREFQAGADPAGGRDTASSDAASQASVRVNAQQRWTDARLDVRAGDTITFAANGSVTLSDNASDTATAAGSSSGRRAPDAPIMNQLAGGLLGRIGDYGPIWIGARGTLTAPASGRLYLGVNDDHLADNRGDFAVTVGVQRRPLR